MIKVLIVEDEPLIIKMYQKALDASEFQVISLIGGDGVIEAVKLQKPNIVLLDVMMPEPNGIKVLELLKADEATKAVPVIIFTNLSGKSDSSYTLSKGALDYWIKNEVRLETLGQKIKTALKL